MIIRQIIDFEKWLLICSLVILVILTVYTVLGLLYQKRVNQIINEDNYKPLYNPWRVQRILSISFLTIFLVFFSGLLFAPKKTINERINFYEYERYNYDLIDENDKEYIYKDMIENQNDIYGYALKTEKVDNFIINTYTSKEGKKTSFIIFITLETNDVEIINDTYFGILDGKVNGNLNGYGSGSSFYKSQLIIGETEEQIELHINIKHNAAKLESSPLYELTHKIVIG